MESLYKGHRFPRKIISHAVWLYHRFTLSYREHRAAAGHNDLPLTLQGANDQLALCMLKNPPPPKPPRSPAHEQILDALDTAESLLVFSELRQACRMRTETFCNVLTEMQRQGKVIKTPNGYQLVSAAETGNSFLTTRPQACSPHRLIPSITLQIVPSIIETTLRRHRLMFDVPSDPRSSGS